MQPWNPTLTSKSATLEWGTRIMGLNSRGVADYAMGRAVL
jgi:hypothetical protein